MSTGTRHNTGWRGKTRRRNRPCPQCGKRGLPPLSGKHYSENDGVFLADCRYCAYVEVTNPRVFDPRYS